MQVLYVHLNSDLGSLDGWTFAQKLLGVTTHYKLHREDGSITIRIQGELTGCSVFDQVRPEWVMHDRRCPCAAEWLADPTYLSQNGIIISWPCFGRRTCIGYGCLLSRGAAL